MQLVARWGAWNFSSAKVKIRSPRFFQRSAGFAGEKVVTRPGMGLSLRLMV
jgi:hypothetical protein